MPRSRAAQRPTRGRRERDHATHINRNRGGRYTMNAPASITITPVFVADLSVEGERMPVYVHVIDHPDARVLVDTGMTELHPAMADLDPRLRPLSEQDFDLAGIDIVVNTHLHADHCGGNHLFAGRPIYVQRRELDDARSEDDYTIREWVEAPGVRYVPVDGEHELLPGLRLVPAPGHTRRHADGRRRDWRAPGHRRRRRGGVVRRVRRAAHRRPAAGPCARPRAGLARARARAMATRYERSTRSFWIWSGGAPGSAAFGACSGASAGCSTPMTSNSSPVSYISVTMSHPPTSSPLTNS